MINYLIESVSAYFSQGITLNPFFLVLLVGFAIQFLKVIIDSVVYKDFLFSHFFAAWWFPSFHTGLSSSISMFVLLEYGIDSVLFAVVFCFSLLFAYDAMNIRFQTGQHAYFINKIRVQLQETLFKEKQKTVLKERTWHTPFEVFGWFFIGSILTYIFYYLLYLY
jgi:acid phosphatase family membrane protein YuiD